MSQEGDRRLQFPSLYRKGLKEGFSSSSKEGLSQTVKYLSSGGTKGYNYPSSNRKLGITNSIIWIKKKKEANLPYFVKITK